jgi:Fur family peroxide stress response transcriptional regulator
MFHTPAVTSQSTLLPVQSFLFGSKRFFTLLDNQPQLLYCLMENNSLVRFIINRNGRAMTISSSAEGEKRMEQMLTKLRSSDFRITPQRMAVLRILASSKDHPSAEQIFDIVRAEFPTTSLATIYKTVALLRDLHEVLELGFPDGGNRYDGNMPFPHPHVICTKCKKIMDHEFGSLDALREEIGRSTGYKILYHRVDFFGLCQECQKAEQGLR